MKHKFYNFRPNYQINKGTSKLVLLCLFFLFHLITVFSQNSSYLPVVIQPSPEAAALAKFIESPVSYYNGLPEINIPLYEVIEGDIKVPLTLSYHSSGIKVNEDASCVGLGWNLFAGGEIIVDQRGQNDFDGTGYYYASSLPLGNGDFNSALVHQQSSASCSFISEPGLINGCNFNPKKYDGEPDMFLFNFLNYSGKFIFKRYFDSNNRLYQKAEVLDRQKIIFTGLLNNFTATTPDGSMYFFTKPEYSYHRSLNKELGIIESTNPYPSAVKLSRIKSPSGKEVTFDYKNNLGEIIPTPNISFVHADLQYQVGVYSKNDQGTISNNVIWGNYLEYIRFSTGYVKFILSPRIDLINGLKIDEIRVYQKDGDKLVRTIKFLYDYFTGVSTFGDFLNGTYSGIQNPDYTIQKRSLRLRLLSLQIDSESPYQFTYDPQPLPYKTGFAVDYWGYFNGALNNTTLLPNGKDLNKFSPIPQALHFWQGANREPNEQYMQAGILTSIKYPTGGTISFKYSAHRFENIATAVSMVPKTVVVVANDANHKSLDQVNNDELMYTQNSTINVSVQLWTSQIFNAGICYAGLEKWDAALNLWIKPVDLNWDISEFAGICINDNPSDGCQKNVQYPGGPVTSYFYKIDNAQVAITPGRYRVKAHYPLIDPHIGDPPMCAWIKVDALVPQTVGVLTGGGLRIDEIERDPLNGNKVITSYSYAGGKNLSMPYFTRVIDAYPSFTSCPSNIWGISPGCHEIGGNYGSMMFSNFVVNYSNSANGSIVGYNNVMESYTGKEKGKTEYAFKIEEDGANHPNTILPGMPTPNKLDNGLLLSKTDFSFNSALNSYKMVKKITNQYDIYDKLLNWGFKCEYEPVILECSSGLSYPPPEVILCGSLRLHFYPIRLGRISLLSTKEEIYPESAGSITTIKIFEYNQDGFPIKEEIIDSKKVSNVKETTYASDYLNIAPTDLNINAPWIQTMNAKNMIGLPIEVINKVNGNAIYGNFTVYSISNLTLPTEIYKLELAAPIPIISSKNNKGLKSPFFRLAGTIGYYDFGNIKTEKKADNITTIYLWSYNNSYPVAKIENADYTTVETVLGGKSAVDAFSSKLAPKDTEIISFLAPLYTDIRLSNSMVTSYTYKALIGLNTHTDQKGMKTYFDYDLSGRLRLVKDNDGKIIKQYQYHYQNQQ